MGPEISLIQVDTGEMVSASEINVSGITPHFLDQRYLAVESGDIIDLSTEQNSLRINHPSAEIVFAMLHPHLSECFGVTSLNASNSNQLPETLDLMEDHLPWTKLHDSPTHPSTPKLLPSEWFLDQEDDCNSRLEALS